MNENERHPMELIASTDDEQLYRCPRCERSLVLRFEADGARPIVLERGDPFALHHGSSGPLTISAEL